MTSRLITSPSSPSSPSSSSSSSSSVSLGGEPGSSGPSTGHHRCLAVFGGTRGIGRQLVQQALQANKAVRLLARDPASVTLTHPNLTVIEGDVLDGGAVRTTLQGADAAVVSLGLSPFRKQRLRTEGTAEVISAMKELGVRRIFAVSVLGARESRAVLTTFLKYVFFPLYLRRAVLDHEGQEALLEKSGLDWSIVRPPHLTDGPQTGGYAHGVDILSATSRPTWQVSRADVADFILRHLSSTTYLHKAPALSYERG